MKFKYLLAAAAVSAAVPALAQERAEEPDDDFHNAESRTIVITASGVGALDILAGTTALEAGDIQRNLDGQIGDVLADLPGVSATSFSPGASRPVLRGFQGERVKVLTDGLASLDASNTSADHAVTIDPLTAERIEVLRGPAVLLYGSQAIGGAVNVLDKRIPRKRPDEAVHLDALASYGTAADLGEAGASIDVPVGERLALHVDGSYRSSGDVDVPGYTLSDSLRAEILDEADEEEAEGEIEEAEELREAANQRGVLPNSATETFGFGAGATVFAGGSSLGVSVGYYDTAYGVPGRPGAGHHHGEEEEAVPSKTPLAAHEEEEGEQVSIGLEQWRADLRGEFDLGTGFPFEFASLRFGYSDYTHTEFEGDEIGTVFDVSGFEGRLVLTQQEQENWTGSIGAQVTYRDFQAIGEEAFVAPNRTDQYALFALQEFRLADPLSLEVGGRYERSDVASDALGVSRSFDSLSGAASLVYEIQPGLRAGGTVSRAARAPSAEELFADGPHIATQQYEIGDVNLSEESSVGVETFLRGDIGDLTVNVAAYANWFDDYIFLQSTGTEIDDLPAEQYVQGDARYYGFEAEAVFRMFHTLDFDVFAELGAGYVNAELDDGTPLPRIPPLELTGALEAASDALTARVELAWSAEQDNVAPLETPTDDFLFVDASLAWRPFAGESVTLLAQVRNVFDEEGRRHASFTKDFVPLPGRDLRLSARLSF